MLLKRIKFLVCSMTLVLTLSSHSFASEKYTANECFEKLSRGTLKFNQALDKAIFKPIAKGYRTLPVPIRTGSGNFLGNLRSLLTLSNNILQGDLKGAGNTAGRFAINTTNENIVLHRINNILKLTDKKCPSGDKCNKYGCADLIWFNIFRPMNLGNDTTWYCHSK